MELPARLLSAAHTVAGFGADFAGMSDEQLVEGFRAVSELDRVRGVFAVGLAGEAARRSSREFGYAGLAQRQGFLSPEALIQSITGAPRAEAARQVAVGSALDTPLGVAVLDGRISVDAAEAIQRGLGVSFGASGVPSGGQDAAAGLGGVAEAELAAATEVLIAEAQTTNVDRLFRRARDRRDELDADSIQRREKEQHDLRYLHYSRRGDGMVRGSFLLDPLDGGLVLSALDAVLSPRRGGPRMVDAEQKALDAVLEADTRSTAQIAADALVAMVRLAVDADPGTLFGRRRPAVRVVVGERVLATRTGAGQLEDGAEPVSIETIERLLCDSGVLGIEFDQDGQCVNVGRTQRLFTERQRVALAVRDGGCRFPLCDRPPSWAEAHHVQHWHRDGGKTDVADGILLCRRHHLLVHNNHWEISRDRADYWLAPPPNIDSAQEPIPMPTKARPFERPRELEKHVLERPGALEKHAS